MPWNCNIYNIHFLVYSYLKVFSRGTNAWIRRIKKKMSTWLKLDKSMTKLASEWVRQYAFRPKRNWKQYWCKTLLLTLGDKKVTFTYDIFLKVSNELLGIKTKIFKCFRTVIFTTYIFLYTLTYKYFSRGRYSWEFLLGCDVRFYKSWPYFRPKMSFSTPVFGHGL